MDLYPANANNITLWQKHHPLFSINGSADQRVPVTTTPKPCTVKMRSTYSLGIPSFSSEFVASATCSTIVCFNVSMPAPVIAETLTVGMPFKTCTDEHLLCHFSRFSQFIRRLPSRISSSRGCRWKFRAGPEIAKCSSVCS